jgi:hypothetical protein
MMGTQTNGTSYLWTTNGDGTFDDATSLTATYDPGTTDISTGLVKLKLTIQSASPCVAVADSMYLTIKRQALASAGADATICETGTYTLSSSTATYAASMLWTASGTGTFNNASLLHPAYTPSANDLLDGEVTLTLTVQSEAPCVSVTDQMVLNFSKQATVSAGDDATICEISTYTMQGTQTNGASYLWTTNGDGSFNDATSLTAIYTPGSSDITTGSVILTLNVQSVLPCTPVSDAMILHINRRATATAGMDATICETTVFGITGAAANYATAILWTTSGTGSFDDPTIIHPIYTPSANDLDDGHVTLTLNVQSAPTCPSMSDKMELYLKKQAIVEAGENATICQTGTLLLQATQSNASSLVWTTSGDGSFSNASELNPVYTPGTNDISSGIVILTLTAQSAYPCQSVSDAITLTIKKQATVNAGTDATICETGTYTLSSSTTTNAASMLWTTSGTGTFSDASLLHPAYTPSTNDLDDGQVTLTLTVQSDAPCVSVADAMVLNFSKQATVSAGDDATICETSTYTLQGTQTNGTSYLWTTSGNGTFSNANILNPVYTPGSNDIALGMVSLTLTIQSAAPCVSVNDVMVLHIHVQPSVSAGVSAGICQGATYTLNTSSAVNTTSFLWSSSGTGTFSNPSILHPVYTPSQNDIDDGFVVLTIASNEPGQCTVATDTMTLYIYQLPTVFAGDDVNICNGSSYTVTDAEAYNYSSISWSTNGLGYLLNASTLSPTYVPALNETGVVSLTLTAVPVGNGTCNPVTDVMNIHIIQLTLSLNTVANVNCYGSSTGSIAANAGGGSQPYTYLWSNGSTDQTISQLQSGTYYLTVTDNNGCTVSGSAEVIQPSEPLIVQISAVTQPYCTGYASGSATVSVSGGTAPYQYLWSNNQSNSMATSLTQGTYVVTVTDSQGCSATAMVILTDPTGLQLNAYGIDNVSCYGGSDGSATVEVIGGTLPYSYQWNTGAQTSSITSVPAGLYHVTVTDNNGCTGIATVSILQPTQLIAEVIGQQQLSCNGTADGTATVNATGGTTPYIYSWSNGQNTPTATGLAAGNYTVTVTDALGCSASTYIYLTAPNSLTAFASTTSNVICGDDNSGIVHASANGGTGLYTYNWSNGSSGQTIYGLEAGIYQVSVTDANGCVATASTEVVTDDDVPPVISNPSPLTFSADLDLCSASGVVLIPPSASDNCSSVVLTNNAPLVFNVGVTMVTWTATDISGNTSTSVQTVTITDQQPPAVICPADVVHNGMAFITVPIPGVTDNCGIASVTNDFNGTGDASGNYPAGNTAVTWTVTDIHGNTNTCVMYVIITCELEAYNDTVAIPMNAMTVITVIQNDSACGEPVECTDITILVNGQYTVTVVDPITGQISCFPVSGFVGQDSVLYRICCTTVASKEFGVTDNFTVCSDAWIHITVHPAPTACISGSSTICPGGSASLLLTMTGTPPYNVVLNNGVSNLLYTGITTNLFPIFVSPTSTTTYTIVSVQDATTVTGTSTCSAVVSVLNLNSYVVTGGGAYCVNGQGSIVGLSGSESGAMYELFRDNVSTGIFVPGNGLAISFGYQTVPGTYTVRSSKLGCTKLMNSSVTVNILPQPSAFIVSGGGACCFGCTDIHVYLSSSQQGITYTLKYNGLTVVSSLPGTGNPLDFGYVTSSGTYSVVATNSLGCSNQMYGSAIATIYPKPIAQLVTPDTVICSGQTIPLTVHLSSGSPPYNVTISNGTSSNTYNLVMGPNLVVNVSPQSTTTYSCTVVSDLNGCANYGIGTTTVTVQACNSMFNKIKGKILYDNAANTAITNTRVVLVSNTLGALDSVYTDAFGYYQFDSITAGDYSVYPRITKPWGGINSTDALKIMRYFVNLDSLSPLEVAAADVTMNFAVNSIDALLVMKRFVHMVSAFPSGDWQYSIPPITVSGSDATVNILAICSGDVDNSYVPPLVKIAPRVNIEQKGTLNAGNDEEIMIPVNVSHDCTIGAVSLVISYPKDRFTVTGIVLDSEDGMQSIYNILDGEIRIAMYDINGMEVNPETPLFYIQGKVNGTILPEDFGFVTASGSDVSDVFCQTLDVELNLPKLIPAQQLFEVDVQPNPSDMFTKFVLTNTSDCQAVEILIYDMLGHLVKRTDYNAVLLSGTHEVVVETGNLSGGLYQYHVSYNDGNRTAIRKGKLIVQH